MKFFVIGGRNCKMGHSRLAIEGRDKEDKAIDIDGELLDRRMKFCGMTQTGWTSYIVEWRLCGMGWICI